LLYIWGNWSWKCWGKWTKVLKYDWNIELVENIKVWDLLMWPDSNPKTVLKLWRWQEILYKIIPERDEPFIVNESHILSLIQRRKNRKWNRINNLMDYAPEWELVNIPIKDYLLKPNRWKSEAKIWRPNKVYFNKNNKLDIDPYFLWVWLWDWASAWPRITTADIEISERLYEFAFLLWLKITRWDRNKIWHSLSKVNTYNNIILDKLREYNLIQNKHIPFEYLTSDYNSRLELLAWILDTDWYNDWKWFAITQKRKQLAVDISYLARSLWFKVNQWTKIARMKRKDWSIYECEVYWNTIQWDCTKIPNKIKRKKHTTINTRSDCLLTWFKIEQLSVWDYYWFELDWDHLFLDGNFRVQHNTAVWCYIDILKALWKELCKKYNLPYIWESRQTLVVTKTSDSINTNLEPYFIGWEWYDDIFKIPPEVIKWNPKRDNATKALKMIELINGNKILFRTYDAWQARLEGSSPDFIHLDELPEREDIFIELLRWTRKPATQMMLTFTPTKFNPAVFDYFYWQNSQAIKDKTYIREVDSQENKYWDHTWLEWLSPEEYKIRRFGKFIPPTWLVYNEFRRDRNLIPELEKKFIQEWRVFCGLDFWTKHPMSMIFLLDDWDWHYIAFDEIHESKMLLWDLKIAIQEKERKRGINIEYIVSDSAWAREALELKAIWVHTQSADKYSKGENNMSNRRAWILKINWLFHSSSLYVTENCKGYVRELETHAYKWNGSEAVIKENDDICDAARYALFSIKPKSITRQKMKNIKRIKNKYSKIKERY
jgi:hypothetical protein